MIHLQESCSTTGRVHTGKNFVNDGILLWILFVTSNSMSISPKAQISFHYDGWSDAGLTVSPVLTVICRIGPIMNTPLIFIL